MQVGGALEVPTDRDVGEESSPQTQPAIADAVITDNEGRTRALVDDCRAVIKAITCSPH
jgi:hypothetical protein